MSRLTGGDSESIFQSARKWQATPPGALVLNVLFRRQPSSRNERDVPKRDLTMEIFCSLQRLQNTIRELSLGLHWHSVLVTIG